MRYKIGDVVRVKTMEKLLSDGKECSNKNVIKFPICNFYKEQMEKYCWKLATIVYLNKEDVCYKIDDSNERFCDDMLEDALPRLVFVRDCDYDTWEKRTLIDIIDNEKVNRRFVCVAAYSEDCFKKWVTFDVCHWREIKEIPEEKIITITSDTGEKIEITEENAKKLWFKIL